MNKGQKYFIEPGEVYGYLTVIKLEPKIKNKKRMYKCICKCGKETYAEAWALKTGNKKHRSALLPRTLGAVWSFASGARCCVPFIARCKRKFLPAGGRNSPARPRDQPKYPLLEGSRHRIRLLRVHSHSHGGHLLGADKRKAHGKKSRASVTQVISSAIQLFHVCRLHGAVFSPVFVCFLHSNRCFFHPTRTFALFQAILRITIRIVMAE